MQWPSSPCCCSTTPANTARLTPYLQTTVWRGLPIRTVGKHPMHINLKTLIFICSAFALSCYGTQKWQQGALYKLSNHLILVGLWWRNSICKCWMWVVSHLASSPLWHNVLYVQLRVKRVSHFSRCTLFWSFGNTLKHESLYEPSVG